MTYEDFKQIIKTKRLTGDWYQFIGEVEGKQIALKGYKTWLQVYRVNELQYSNLCDRKVSQFNNDLKTPFNYPDEA